MATPRPDDFAPIARYYDALMDHVDYLHWRDIVLDLRAIAGTNAPHLDAACGTGVLAAALRKAGCPAFGFDLSPAMVAAQRLNAAPLPLAVADMTALPFRNAFGSITCLFDSLNFLPSLDAIGSAFAEFHRVLCPGGVLYCDIVTERMVRDHFANQDWEESNGSFKSRWSGSYDAKSGLAETAVRINNGDPACIREHIYPPDAVQRLFAGAGFHVLGMYDADTWRAPGRKTTRIDFFALREPPTRTQMRAFERFLARIAEQVQSGF